jgi:hypothetical protein
MRQDFIYQQGSTVRHPSCSTTGTETAPLATEGDKFLVMTGFTPNPKKTILKPSALQVLIKFLSYVRW